MRTTEKSIELDVPVRTAYDQWTQFEEFPRFMEGVEEVRQIDDTHTHWRTKVAGMTEEYDAVITEQRPDQCVAWKATSGPRHAGRVRFEPLAESRSRVTLQIETDPDGVTEKAGAAIGVLDRQVTNDLERFKDMIERRRVPTGGWRGTVDPGPR